MFVLELKIKNTQDMHCRNIFLILLRKKFLEIFLPLCFICIPFNAGCPRINHKSLKKYTDPIWRHTVWNKNSVATSGMIALNPLEKIKEF